MENNEIRQANHRALPKFILFLAVSAVVGGLLGFFSARYGLYSLSAGLQNAGAFFGSEVAPWLMLALALLLPLVSIPCYRGAKRLLDAWDGEDEAVSDAVDARLSGVIWGSGAALIVSFFLIAAVYASGMETFDSPMHTRRLFLAIAAFLAVMVEAVLLQQKCVDAAKRTNPEKTASVYDMHFQKKWMENCDEAEKLLLGRCALKAYSAANTVCCVLAIVLAIAALLLDIGFLPSLVVCLIWLVNQSVYFREAVKCTRPGRRVR